MILSRLDIRTFRGIQELQLDDLSMLNILAGINNSGKTSVLEAIKMISSPDDIGTITRLAFLRASGIVDRKNNIVECVSSLYRLRDKDAARNNYELYIDAKIRNSVYSCQSYGKIGEVTNSVGESSKTFTITSQTSKDNDISAFFDYEFVNGVVENFGRNKENLFDALYIHAGTNYYKSCVTYLSEMIINEQKYTLLRLLHNFDEEIDDISIIGNDVYIHNKFSGTLPLYAYGTGLQKVALLAAVVVYSQNGVLLVDEIDNAINISSFREVFPWFVQACRDMNIQTFVTTHNAEAIDAILDCCREDADDDIRVITLRKTPKTHRTIAKIRTGKMARSDREKFEMELRL